MYVLEDSLNQYPELLDFLQQPIVDVSQELEDKYLITVIENNGNPFSGEFYPVAIALLMNKRAQFTQLLAGCDESAYRQALNVAVGNNDVLAFNQLIQSPQFQHIKEDENSFLIFAFMAGSQDILTRMLALELFNQMKVDAYAMPLMIAVAHNRIAMMDELFIKCPQIKELNYCHSSAIIRDIAKAPATVEPNAIRRLFAVPNILKCASEKEFILEGDHAVEIRRLAQERVSLTGAIKAGKFSLRPSDAPRSSSSAEAGLDERSELGKN